MYYPYEGGLDISGPSFTVYRLICNDLLSSIKIQETTTDFILLFLKAPRKSFGVSVPGLGHSDIRGLVTAGQWSAVSPTLYLRGSQNKLCQHSPFVDDSNLEVAEALSRCPQYLFFKRYDLSS